MTGCRGCSVHWTGLAVAHCGACHRTFSSVSTFDRHRAAKYAEGEEYTRTSASGEVTTHHRKVEVRPYGECYDPIDDGMVQNERGHWAMPNDGYDFASRRAAGAGPVLVGAGMSAQELGPEIHAGGGSPARGGARTADGVTPLPRELAPSAPTTRRAGS